MAKKPTPVDATPEDFAQGTPRDLHATSDIRFVMRETATLTERIEGLSKAIDKLGTSFEKSLDRHSADLKERLSELRTDHKETTTKLGVAKESIDSFKGAMKVFGGLYALALVLTAAFLAWYLRPTAVAPTASAPTAKPVVAVQPSKAD